MNKKSQIRLRNTLVCLVLLLGISSFYFVMAGNPTEDNSLITYTLSTDTVCNEGVCNLILYSGIRNVY